MDKAGASASRGMQDRSVRGATIAGWRGRVLAVLACIGLFAPALAGATDTLTPADRASIAAEIVKSGHFLFAGLSESRIDNPEVGPGSDGEYGDNFGFVTAVNGNTAVIGAPYDAVGANTGQGSAYVFVRVGTAWSMQAKLTDLDGAAGDNYGGSVAISGETILVGARYHSAHNAAHDGAAYVYVRSGSTWSLQAMLSAADGGTCGGGQFGYAVALSGNTALVGETRNCTFQYGAAHVFVRSGSTWSEQAALHASDASPAQGGQFGSALGLDGNIAVVGDYQWYDGAAGYPGSAYVFARSGTSWTQQAQLFSSDNEVNSYFGASVGVSGTSVVVAAPFKTVGGNTAQGAAYVFTQSGSTWPLQQLVTTTDGSSNSYFGNYLGNGVALSGETLAIGAQGGLSGISGARAYVFTRSSGTWTQRKIIRGGAGSVQIGSAGLALDNGTLVAGGPTNPDCGKAFVQTGSGASWNAQATLDRGCSPAYPGGAGTAGFGGSIDVDGDTAVVSAPQQVYVAGTWEPRVYVFKRQDADWILQQTLVPDDGVATYYGWGLAVHADRIAVASPYQANTDGSTGAVFVFRRSGATWVQEAELTGIQGYISSDGTIAMSDDTLVAGDTRGHGTAAVYVRSGTTWTLQATLAAQDGAEGDRFGNAVAIDGNTVLVGARNDTVGVHSAQGSAYLFTRSGSTWSQQQKLVAPDADDNDNFGASVALSGSSAAVGAPYHQAGTGSSGQAYVWLRTGTSWALQGTLSEDGSQQYGASIAMEGDTLAVGAPYGYQYLSLGGTYVYWRSGTAWSLHDELANPDVQGASTNDYFGQSVALDNGVTFIGAPGVAGLPPFGNPHDGAAFAYAYVEATTTTITGITPEPSHVGSAATVNVTIDAERVAATSGTVAVAASTGETCTITTLTGNAGNTTSTGSCTLTFSTLGTRNVTAAYSGAATYEPSTSAPVAHGVDKAATTLSISSDSPDPSVVGQPYEVVVALTGAFQPGGTIAVSDGSANCSMTLPQASCSLTSTTAGSKTLTATYAGDALNLGSSATTAHTVGKAATTTSITADAPDPSAVGQAYVVSVAVVAVAPGGGTPAGSVSVTDGAATCSITLPAASCSLTSTTPGAKTLVATYAGNANYLGSTSPGVAHTVSNQLTSTAITGTAPSPSVVGQPVGASYTVTAASGTPTGNVTVTASSGESCTGTVAAGTCTLTFAGAGNKSLVATYAGDSNYAGSSGSASHVVNKGSVSVSVGGTPATTVTGQPFTATVTVSATPPAAGIPTGSVTLSASGSAGCSATLSGGTGSCTLSWSAPGSYTVTASYGGDANFTSGTGTASHTVNKANVVVAVSEAPASSVVGQPVLVTASVTAAPPGAGTPTGAVAVTAGSLGCNATLSGGSASCTITPTAAGQLTISAAYAGDGNFNAGSGSHAHLVNKAATTIAITSDEPDPSQAGQAYTVVVGLGISPPGSGTPSGSIDVSDGGASCTIALPATSCALTSITGGEKTLVATYAGDASFLGSTSPGESHTVERTSTTTTIDGTAPSPSVVGQAVVVSYSVEAAGGTPTGNVTVTASSGETCTGTAAAASCSLTFADAGTKALVAHYAGDGGFAPSDGSGTHVVEQGDVVVETTVSPEGSVTGQPLTIEVSVTAAPPAHGTPTGNVQVVAGALSCSIALDDGSGSCSLTPTGAGVLDFTATYGGSTNFHGNSDGVSHTVDPAQTTLAIEADQPDPSMPGEPVDVTVSITVAAPGGGEPTGSISVGDGVDSCTIELPATTCTLALSSTGARQITASYEGDGDYLASSVTEPHQVLASADLSATLTDQLDFVEPGQPVVYVLVAANAGPQDASAVHVGDHLPLQLEGATWTCTAAGGGTCTAEGSGDIDQSVDLPAGASVTFVLTATVAQGMDEAIVNQASVEVPAGVSDPLLSNNVATDTDVVVVFRDGFDGDTAAPPVVQSMEELGSGPQSLRLSLDAADGHAARSLLELRDAHAVGQARLVLVPIGGGWVCLLWLQKEGARWRVAESRWFEQGAWVQVGWTQSRSPDGSLAAAAFVIFPG